MQVSRRRSKQTKSLYEHGEARVELKVFNNESFNKVLQACIFGREVLSQFLFNQHHLKEISVICSSYIMKKQAQVPRSIEEVNVVKCFVRHKIIKDQSSLSFSDVRLLSMDSTSSLTFATSSSRKDSNI